MKENKLDITGTIQLNDSLATDYFIHTESDNQCISISNELNKLIGKNIYIQLIHVKNGKDLFIVEGLLNKRKDVTEDFFVGDQNLSDVLWILTKTNVRLIVDVDCTNDKEDGAK